MNIASVAGMIGSRRHMESALGCQGCRDCRDCPDAPTRGRRRFRRNSESTRSRPAQSQRRPSWNWSTSSATTPPMALVAATFDGQLGDPVDVAYAWLYLASDEAKWVTGVNVVIDGGATVLI
jgi:NAD(P)-dependent dehydrogenase (short-subunit alcohol dehydrogenase family)